MTGPDVTTVAFVGLGRMGAPMATNVAAAGYTVHVYNRTRAVADDLAKHTAVTVADTPRAAAAAADVVITMLADESALLAVYAQPEGLLAGWSPGKVAVDMGTTGPPGTAQLADLVGSHGGIVIDAPVSGSTAAAQSQTLTIMVGGPVGPVERIRPVLAAMGSSIYHLGDTGAGSVMKLAVNAVIYGIGQAVSESLVLAERAGIPRQTAYEVFCNSAVAAPMVKYRTRNFVDPENAPVPFAMTLARKDLQLITSLAAELGALMPQAAVNLDTIEAAVAEGLGNQDMAAVAVHLRRAATTQEASA